MISEYKMNTMTELLQSTLQLRSKECLKTYLESCNEYCSFLVKDGGDDSLLKLINALLNGNEDERHQGLSLLQTCVTQCTVRVFSENAVNWLLQCIKISVNKCAPDTCGLALHIFKTILGMSVKFPEVAKEVAKQVVPKFLLEHVRRRQKQLVATVQVLQCVEVCMKNYGGPTGEFRNDIANIVCHLLESSCATVAMAAKCFALLPHIGSGGSQGVTHKTAWGQQQSVVIVKIHDFLDDLFVNVNEIQTYSKPKIELPGVILNLPPLTDPSPVMRAQRLTKQLSGLMHFLQAMLLGDFSVTKTVMPGIILGVVCRCLAVTHTMLANRVSMESQALMAVLPQLHTAALKTLDTLILCCGRNLIQYGRTICRLITQVINSTSTDDWPYGVNKPHRSLRVSVLKTLSLWLTIARSSSSVEVYAEDILTLLFMDIQSEKQSVTLSLARKGPKGRKFNKRQSSMCLSLSGQDHSEKLSKVLANRDLCAAALHAVENILQVASASIKPELHKMVQRIVVGLVIKVTQSCNNNEMPIPYSDTKCRVGLYQLLHTLCTEPHPSLTSPVQYAVHLFSVGLKDPVIQVQSFCQKSLSSIDKIIRPNAPPLSLPLQSTEHQVHSGAVHVNTDLEKPLSSIANKDGYIVLRLVQEGNSTILEPAKNMVAENMRRFSSESNVMQADYQPNTESKGIVISNPVSINTEEQEACMETEENYYTEEYENGNEDDDGGGGDDVDDEENCNYEENVDDNEEEVEEEEEEEGEVGVEAGEDESDVEVISVSSGGCQEEEEEEEECEDIGEEECEGIGEEECEGIGEEECEDIGEEECEDIGEEEEEECTGVEKHIQDEEDNNELHRLAAKRQYANVEIEPVIVEKRRLQFEEEREQKRFKPSKEDCATGGESIQVLQPAQLNKNICSQSEFVKPDAGSVNHENESDEPVYEVEKAENHLFEPENGTEKTESDRVESERICEKTENDIIEPENGFERTENDNIEHENGSEKAENDFTEHESEVEPVKCEMDVDKAENDFVEPVVDSVKPENHFVESKNDSDKPVNNSAEPQQNDLVRPDMKMEVDNIEREKTVQKDESELQQEPESEKTDEVTTDNETDNKVQQSELNGCKQSIMEGEINEQNEEDSKAETEVEQVTEDSVVSKETEVNSECPNQLESSDIKETVSETTSVEDNKSNNIENSQENPDDQISLEKKSNNNKENEHSSKNDNNIEINKVEVSKKVNTISNDDFDDDDEEIDEEKMVKDFADVVESLI